MSVVFSGSFTGSFKSDGKNKILALPSGYNNIMVRNYTVLDAAGADLGAEFVWQTGMPNGGGLQYIKTAVTNALAPDSIAAGNGFWFYDPSDQAPGQLYNISTISNATPPLVTTSAGQVTAAGIQTGDVVRIFKTTGATQLAGYDFTVTYNASDSFKLSYMQPIVAGTTGTWRKIPYGPLFYPSVRYITNISQATEAIVTLSVTHNLTVGQKVRFKVPSIANSSVYFGMTELNDLSGTIVAINEADADGYTNTITVDIDTTNFTAFAFPLTGTAGFTPAQIVPYGENTAEANSQLVDPFAGARNNTGEIGVLLTGGAGNPGGDVDDQIYWIAWKSFNQ